VPNAPAPKPDRDFCVNCGYPIRGSRCEACGAAREPQSSRDSYTDDVPTKQTQFKPYAPEADADMHGIERAIEAFRAKDLPRFVEHLLAVEGVGTARAAAVPEGTGFIATVRGGVVFVSLRITTDELWIDAPIARVPTRQRMPALRLALELCGRQEASSRVAIRGDLLLLRFGARLSSLTPQVLRHYLREVGALAARYAGLLTVSFDALPAIADDQRAAVGFEMLGRARKLQLAGHDGRPPAAPPPAPPPLPRRSMPPQSAAPKERTSSPMEDARAGAGTGPLAAVPRASVSRPIRREEVTPQAPDALSADAMPAVLAPMFAAPASTPTPAPVAASSAALEEWKRGNTAQTGQPVLPKPTGAARPEIDLELSARRPTPRAPAEAFQPAAPAGPAPRPPMEALHDGVAGGAKPRAHTEPMHNPRTGTDGFDAPKARPSEEAPPQLSPSDRLCLLLRHAQSLASLTLEERPATMTWLVRSVVFRAIYDYREVLPDSVAHLYRCTGVGREGSITARTASSQNAAVEPALAVMERIVVARGAMPKESPLALEPMTSATQAKEHVARYLQEIERAPADVGLRHFLALGALTELLVRTKLPPQTDQRLRDIVSHAQREGAKSGAIDLMMTALQRINA
jgi:hypothetical protein